MRSLLADSRKVGCLSKKEKELSRGWGCRNSPPRLGHAARVRASKGMERQVSAHDGKSCVRGSRVGTTIYGERCPVVGNGFSTHQGVGLGAGGGKRFFKPKEDCPTVSDNDALFHLIEHSELKIRDPVEYERGGGAENR